ncbi:MAG: ACT domain-containing protein [Desulfurivibrio sp.]|nr:ACT domain-containing protein [Desulfurivibrio sp.]
MEAHTGKNEAHFDMILEVDGIDHLNRILQHIRQIDGIDEAHRR